MTEYSSIDGESIPWNSNIEETKPLTQEDLAKMMEQAKHNFMNERSRPPIKLVNFARYQALSKIHQMDEFGSFCKVCGDYYTMVNLERCVAK